MPVEQPEFKLEFSGQQFSTGLMIPEEIPTSFASFPPAETYDLADLKKIYGNKNRRSAIDLYTRRKQQGRKSSCCGYAITTCGELKRVFDRKQDVEIGPEWIYSRYCEDYNRGQDSGALLDKMMQLWMAEGSCLRDSVPYQIHTLNQMSMEQKRFAAQQAKEFRLLDANLMPIKDLDECWKATLSAIARRNPVLGAVHCGRNFFACGPDGECQPDKGPGNHAVAMVELTGVETAGSLRDIGIITINSHGKRYGNNGCFVFRYGHMCGPVEWHSVSSRFVRCERVKKKQAQR